MNNIKRRRKPSARARIEPLINELTGEIAKLVVGVFAAADAGERPHVSLKSINDVIARIEMAAAR